MSLNSEYKCAECGHDFDKILGVYDGIVCPRCHSERVETNPYLLRTCKVDELTEDDYFAVALKP